MNDPDFKKCIDSIKNAETVVRDFSERIPSIFGPEITNKITQDISNSLLALSEVSKEIEEIKKIYQLKTEIQQQILNPVSEAIQRSSRDAISSINISSMESIKATRHWAIISVFVAILVGFFLSKTGEYFQRYLRWLNSPVLTYQVGSLGDSEKAFFEASGTSLINLLQFNGDQKDIWELAKCGTQPIRISNVYFTVGGADVVVKTVSIFPEDDFPLAVKGFDGKIPGLFYHPVSINSKHLGFIKPQQDSFISRLSQKGMSGYNFALINPKKKDKVKVRALISVFVDSFNLGSYGKYFGSTELLYYKDFEINFTTSVFASGTFDLDW